MANYSYNDLKIEFEDLREDWMPAALPSFQAPDNTSNANSKIYPRVKYSGAVGFFENKRALNPFCNRVNCYNVNLQHTHTHPETKQEYTEKVVRFLRNWQIQGLLDGSLDQTQSNQLTNIIKLWNEKNPFLAQEKAVRDHWNQTNFNIWQGGNVCLDIVDKLKKEIKDGKITDDAGPDDPDYEMCSACLAQYNLVNNWEKNYRQKIDKNCRQGQHSQSPPIPSELELKIHNKCWKKVNKNSYDDIQLCGCSNVKVSELLEATSPNLVKSLFIINKVKKIIKETSSTFRAEGLNGRGKVISSNQDDSAYDNLVAFFQPFPVGRELVRKDLGIGDEPHDDTDLEKVRKQILIYFQEHGIEKVRVEGNKLIIKYNHKEEEVEKEANSPELQQIQSYCSSKGVNSLTLNDLKKGSNNQELGYGKILFYGGIAVVVFCVVGLIAYLAYYRSKKNSQNRMSY